MAIRCALVRAFVFVLAVIFGFAIIGFAGYGPGARLSNFRSSTPNRLKETDVISLMGKSLAPAQYQYRHEEGSVVETPSEKAAEAPFATETASTSKLDSGEDQLEAVPGDVAKTSDLCYQDRQLSRDESYNFFEDTSESWAARKKVHLTQMKLQQKNKDVLKACTNPMSNTFWDAHYEPSFSCAHQRRVGRWGDGGKWVCDPHTIAQKATSKDRCLVYSIGSRGEYGFEQSVHNEISASCEIVTVDLQHWSKYTERTPPDYVKYHVHEIGPAKKGKTDISALVKLLNHSNRVIELFKIDIEGSEWRTYKSWLGEGVFIRQIQVEVHGLHEGVRVAHDFFKFLFDSGYVIFHKEPNLECYKCVEYSFIKLRPSFSEDIPAPYAHCSSGDNAMSKRQSHGFMDEPDVSWRKRRAIHKAQHNLQMKHLSQGLASMLEARWFWDSQYNPTFSCVYEQRIGKFGAGGKYVCDPHKITASAESTSCLVYATGSPGVSWPFDKSVQDQISKKCQVVHLDPTKWDVDARIKGTKPNYAGTSNIPDTYKSLGHEGRTIDILQIDCNGCEWTSFQSWFGDVSKLDVFIRQILVKVYGVQQGVSVVNALFEMLHKKGYVIFHKEADLVAKGNNIDYSFVRLDQTFFH